VGHILAVDESWAKPPWEDTIVPTKPSRVEACSDPGSGDKSHVPTDDGHSCLRLFQPTYTTQGGTLFIDPHITPLKEYHFFRLKINHKMTVNNCAIILELGMDANKMFFLSVKILFCGRKRNKRYDSTSLLTDNRAQIFSLNQISKQGLGPNRGSSKIYLL
jgi:hypothetical protein